MSYSSRLEIPGQQSLVIYWIQALLDRRANWEVDVQSGLPPRELRIQQRQVLFGQQAFRAQQHLASE